MSVDTQRLMEVIPYINALWSGKLSIYLSIYLSIHPFIYLSIYLMSIDTQRLMEVIPYINALWSGKLSIYLMSFDTQRLMEVIPYINALWSGTLSIYISRCYKGLPIYLLFWLVDKTLVEIQCFNFSFLSFQFQSIGWIKVKHLLGLVNKTRMTTFIKTKFKISDLESPSNSKPKKKNYSNRSRNNKIGLLWSGQLFWESTISDFELSNFQVKEKKIM